MMKYSFLFAFLLTINGYSQQNDTQAALYNIGIGSVFGGVGALINKKPNEKNTKVFIKGLYQGALGGAVVYGSKKMVYNFHKNENLNMLWSSKLVHATGVSIIENAASNRDFWEKWHISIGFNRLELDTKDKLKLHYKVMPTALAGSIILAVNGDFNLKYSLQTLTPVFLGNEIIDMSILERTTRGVTIVNSILIFKENYNDIMAHEFLHTMQYDDYMTVNMFFNKKRTTWKNKKSFINKWSNLVYTDTFSFISHYSLYLSEYYSAKCYFDNYFEAEANFYSKKISCP